MVEEKADKKIPIRTSHGPRYVAEGDIFHFPGGLPGFPEYTDYVFFDIEGCEPFRSMLSVDEGGPDFVVVEPASVIDGYDPLGSVSSVGNLGLGDPLEIVVLSIVTLAENPKDITVNLRGPLFVNLSTKRGRQVILDDESLPTRFPLMAEG